MGETDLAVFIDNSNSHHQWEMMELDEEPAETQRDTFRIAHITQPPDTTNSAKLVFWNNHLYWLKDAEDWKLRNEFGSQGETSHIEASVPLLRCESSIADTSSIAGSQKWERLPAGNGTSGSSIDLEWENEAGLTPPPHFIIPTADDLTWLGLSDVSSNHSHPSTPVSNGNDLEWDFTRIISTASADCRSEDRGQNYNRQTEDSRCCRNHSDTNESDHVPVNEDDDEKDQATTINNKTENGNIER